MEANTVQIYKAINLELKKILSWCKQPDKTEGFDLDDVYIRLFDQYRIDMNYGFLHPIFSLVDVMCDSIRHDQININDGYKVEDGIADLQYIVDCIDADRIQELENNVALKRKLNRLYS